MSNKYRRKYNHIGISLVTAALMATLAGGCGNDGGGSSSSSSVTGIFADGAIGNAEYRCSSTAGTTTVGTTNTDGEFTCPSGSSVSFYYGNLKLGEVSSIPGDEVILIQNVLGVDRSETSNSTVILLAQLL